MGTVECEGICAEKLAEGDVGVVASAPMFFDAVMSEQDMVAEATTPTLNGVVHVETYFLIRVCRVSGLRFVAPEHA
jgi:hypothetical protein